MTPKRRRVLIGIAAVALLATSAGCSRTDEPRDASPDTTVDGDAGDATGVPDESDPSRDVADASPPAEADVQAPRKGFIASFAGNVGLDEFRTGVFHRDDIVVKTTSWTGDHDLDCGSPDTQRTIRRDHPDESFYLCRDHLMTSVGDTSGYSIAWFSPDRTFSASTDDVVAWDVNVTDLGLRQWWEVVILPVDTKFLTTADWVAEKAKIDPYQPETIAIGSGPYGGAGNISVGGVLYDPLGRRSIADIDPEGAESKAIRRSFMVTDLGNGSLEFSFLGERYTYPGSFPDTFRVYFKDHNYTPDKPGIPAGHTWHWDEIFIGPADAPPSYLGDDTD